MRTGRASELSPLLLAAVFAGTAAGSLARWGLGLAIPAGYGMLAVLIVNLVGSFCLGLLLEALAWRQDRMPADWLRLAQRGLGTGLLGGFTTYSALTVDAAAPFAAALARPAALTGQATGHGVETGMLLWAAGSVIVTLIGGVIAAALGIAAARRWTRPRGEVR
ncbi:CrcB family protein [Brevibacterium luteolum]|uniref:CrcB family protein n=1 Tax=Brevibacterium luteolum TaxID=199591 RepID=UPI003EE9702B